MANENATDKSLAAFKEYLVSDSAVSHRPHRPQHRLKRGPKFLEGWRILQPIFSPKILSFPATAAFVFDLSLEEPSSSAWSRTLKFRRVATTKCLENKKVLQRPLLTPRIRVVFQTPSVFPFIRFPQTSHFWLGTPSPTETMKAKVRSNFVKACVEIFHVQRGAKRRTLA